VAKTRDLEIRLENTEQQLHLVQQISRFMVRDMQLGDALHRAVAMVVEFMHSDSCLLYLLDGQELALVATHQQRTDNIGKVRLKISEGLTGWVARERRMLSISREAYRDPRFKLFSDLLEDTFEAFLSAPVIVRGRVAGVINVQHRDPHFHSGGEMELLTTVGEQLGCLVALSITDLKALNTSQVVDMLAATAARS
jgi:uroporphyrinogen-III synthase